MRPDWLTTQLIEDIRLCTSRPFHVRDSVMVENDCGRTIADCGFDVDAETALRRGLTNAANARMVARGLNIYQDIPAMVSAVEDAVQDWKDGYKPSETGSLSVLEAVLKDLKKRMTAT